MNSARLLGYYERIAESPDSITRLRRFILDLAVRGKLVPQSPKDELAVELLKRITEERARLANAGEISKDKSLPKVTQDEIKFDVPRSWEWVRIREVTSSRGQMIPEQDFTYIDVTAINKEAGRIEDAKIITPDNAPSRARKIVRKGDVLYSCVRPYLLNIAIIEDELSPAPIASTAFAVLNGFGLILPRYQWIVLRSPFMVSCVEEKMRGQAYPAINDSDFALLPIPLPPLAEQHRIVTKVDELMALCDRLETARAEREATRDRLTAASLARLNTPDPATFQDDARFALNILPALTTRPDQIKQLRQTILNLAVRGKLVPQDPNDEDATKLLKKIFGIRRELLASKKLRLSTEITNSINNREVLDIPESWTWAKCDELLFVTKLAGFEYTKYFELRPSGEIPVVRAQNVKPWRLDPSNLLYIEKRISETLERSALIKPCLLITFIGAGIGDVAYFGEEQRWHLAPNVAKIEPFPACEKLLSLQFLLLLLISPFGRSELFKHMKATAQPSISMGTIRDIDFPIPPLAEQQRIVAKVDALMAICDQLEQSLAKTDMIRRRLLESTLDSVLIPITQREAA